MRETKSRTSSGPERFIGGAEISANKTAPSRRTLIVSNFMAIPVLDLMVAAPRRSCKDNFQTAALVFVAEQHHSRGFAFLMQLGKKRNSSSPKCARASNRCDKNHSNRRGVPHERIHDSHDLVRQRVH